MAGGGRISVRRPVIGRSRGGGGGGGGGGGLFGGGGTAGMAPLGRGGGGAHVPARRRRRGGVRAEDKGEANAGGPESETAAGKAEFKSRGNREGAGNGGPEKMRG